MACNSKLYAIILWCGISVNVNIGKKNNRVKNNDILKKSSMLPDL